MSSEELLKAKMAEGWNIHIECKGKGGEYGMSYEGNAYKVNSVSGERQAQMMLTHAYGITMDELLKNMFESVEG